MIALLTDLSLLAFTNANASVDSLARAYSLSLIVAALVSTAVAFRRPEMRPNLRDLAIVVAAVVAMVVAVRPLNALSSHVVAALAVAQSAARSTALHCLSSTSRACARWSSPSSAQLPRTAQSRDLSARRRR